MTTPAESVEPAEETARIKRRAAGYGAGVMTLAALLVGGLTYFGVYGQDAVSIDASERRLDAALDGSLDRLARMARDNAWWDAAHANLVDSVDPEWADDNVGAWMHETYGVSATLVLGPQDEPVFVAAYGAAEPHAQADWGPHIERLADDVRSGAMADSQPMSGVVRWRGELHLAGAAPITPETPTAVAASPTPRSVLMFLQRLDAARLAILAEEQQVSSLAIASKPLVQGNAWVPLHAPDGASLGGLSWQAPTPGTTLLKQVVAPVLTAFIALGVLAFALIRRTIRLAEALERAVADQRAKERLAREAAATAEHANAAKSQFLSHISHELRSPLHTVIGFASFMKEQKLGALGRPEYVDYADQILQEGRRLNQIVEDLLDYTRLSSGAAPLDEQVVDMTEAVLAAAHALEPAAAEKGVALDVSIAPDAPRLVGDERGLRQLARHLIDNAVKFTGADGSVEVRLDRDVAEDGRPRLRFSVSDTGVGIEQSRIEQMLAPFEQADAGIARRHGGVGIGLSLVRLLVRNHGAVLDIQSRVKEGARFTVLFPPERAVAPIGPAIDALGESA
ncbi:MAG: ATP-binding protein [Alphaproteobacteria bacterium]|nr:ATP-binding protein [Alphaproteobacteria bacterium]